MQYGTINTLQLTNALHGAKSFLEKNKEYVDSLNVFPVPDGDTGTNMYLTISAAVREMDKAQAGHPAGLLKSVAGGALMGARGNSGVILSQLFRGFSQGVTGELVDAPALAQALQKAAEMAYRSVIKPVEGTILTVAKAAGEGARTRVDEGGDCVEVLAAAIVAAEQALAATPRLLPVLAEAQVVDAGGQGFLYILQGMMAGLKGESFPTTQQQGLTETKPATSARPVPEIAPVNLEFRYCTELIIKGQDLQTQLLKNELLPLGDSLLVVGDEAVIKLHIHTNRPGLVLEKAGQQGILFDIKIDNMEEQHQEMFSEELETLQKPLNKMGVVAVTVGKGLSSILESLGVDVIVSGGQTMNPSTEDLMAGIVKARAQKVLLLPNNRNIILAAEQAQALAHEQGLEVVVIPTKNFPQSVAALLVYNPDASLADNSEQMKAALSTVKTGEITYAVRDSQYNGMTISGGEILGLVNGEIAVKGEDLQQVSVKLLEELAAKDYELLTVFYGEAVNGEEVEGLKNRLTRNFPHLEIEVHSGGQPLYYYIFGLE